MTRRALDAELVRRGLVATTDEARAAVRAGLVTVSGAPAAIPGAMVADHEPLHVESVRADGYVSRGGDKLRAGLDRFGIDPAGRSCLDAGAGTGGFTDCLLQAGAARVAAVDVGYGQLAWALRTDPRVRVLERTNVRTLTREMLGFAPELVVADLSFISLRTVLPVLASVAEDEATFVLLVKPQFEASRPAAPGGVVRDPDVWRTVLGRTIDAVGATGIGVLGVMASPLRGPAGNVEFLLAGRRGGPAGAPDVEAAIVDAGRIGG